MSERLTDKQLCDIKESHSPMLWDEVSEVVSELIATRKQLATAKERIVELQSLVESYQMDTL